MSKKKKKNKAHYILKDKQCPHCGGNIISVVIGSLDVVIMYWCEDCGSNNRFKKPNIKIGVK